MTDILNAKLENAEFVFLSACHTASGIRGLDDETMHLAASLQFAGFHGAIATMWSVNDKTALKLAKQFYAFIFRNKGVPPNVEDAAEALWVAIRFLKGQKVPLSRLAPFIHLGI